jgi:cell division protease FtsH
MGGRVAEELVFKHVTTGAGNDLEQATDLARKMVCEWGMSDTLGPVTFGQKNDTVFLGRNLGAKRDLSKRVAVEIDLEVKQLVTDNYDRARRILTEHMASLIALAEALLAKEVLDAFDIKHILVQPSAEPVPA